MIRCGCRCGTRTHCMVGTNQVPHTQHCVVIAVAQPTVWWGPSSYLTHNTVWSSLWHNPLYGGDQPATSHATRCGRRCDTTHCMVGTNQLPHTQHCVAVAVAQPTVWWGPTSYLTHNTVWSLLWHNPLYGGDQPATTSH